MSVELRIVLLSSKISEQENSLESLVEVVQQSGFQLAELQMDSASTTEVQQDDKISQLLTKAYIEKKLSLVVAYSVPVVDLELFLDLYWQEETRDRSVQSYGMVVTYQSALFNREEYDSTRYSQLVLDFFVILYNVLRPAFAWIDFADPAGYTSNDDIKRLALPHIYWANLFGPSYVKEIGRKKIRSAPAWVIEELGDGGLLYVLSSCPGLNHEGHVSKEAVKEHFGVKSER